MTRFGTLWPATKFRFDVAGRVVPSPYTVMTPALVGAVTVTFNTTADTPEFGTPSRPATVRCTVPPGATAAFGAPSPVRVSNNRNGTSEVKPPGVVTAAANAGACPEALTGARPASTDASPSAHTARR